MKKHTVIDHIENRLSQIFGMQHDCSIHLNAVELKNDEVYISFNEHNNRHRIITRWDSFTKNDLPNLDKQSKLKLGSAIGKLIAEDLSVSIDVD